MHYLRHILIAVLTVTATAAYAQNVLLPSTDKSNSDKPSVNLGLSPPTPPKPTTPPKISDPKADAVNYLLPTPPAPPPTPGLQSKPTTITPGGTLATTGVASTTNQTSAQPNAFMQIMSRNSQPSGEALRLQQSLKSRLAPAPRAPHFVDDNEEAPSPLYLKALQNRLRFMAAPNYVWGSQDVNSVNEALGYIPNQIPQHCQLRLDGETVTEQGRYHTRAYSGQQGEFAFNGQPKKVSFTPWAVCDQPRATLPQTGNIIGQVGDKYSIALSTSITCPPPPRAGLSLVLTYGGDGKLNCQYQ